MSKSNPFQTAESVSRATDTKARIHEMMYSFVKKYSDVSVHVGDSVFRCNRWALGAFSEYFDVQFERWTSNDENEITLHEVDAEIFAKILEYMDVGRINISASQVYALLCANDYLLIRDDLLQAECIRYMSSALTLLEPFPDALRILEFAHLKQNQTLLSLLSPHILKYMDYFMREARFKELSIDCVNAILKCEARLPIHNDCTVLRAINTWIDHSRVERKQYRKQLTTKLNSANISPSEYLSMMNGYEEVLDNMASTEEGASGIETTSDLHLVYPALASTRHKVDGSKESLHGLYRHHHHNPICHSCARSLPSTKYNCAHCNQYFCGDCAETHLHNFRWIFPGPPIGRI